MDSLTMNVNSFLGRPGMEELYKKFSIEEKLRRSDRPVSAQEGQ